MSSEHEPSFQELPPPPSFSDLYPRRASVAHTDSHYAESAPPTGSTPYLPPAAVPGLFHDASAPSTPRDSAYATPDALSDTARPPFDALGGAPLLARPLSRAPATPPTKEVATPPGSDAGLASGASRYLKTPWYRRPFVWLAAFAVLAIVVLAVVLPVYFVVVKPRRHHGSSSSLGTGGSGDGNGNGGGKGSGANPESPTGATTGGNGSVVVMDDGTNFTYINPFGGYWVYDPKNPFDTSARANSWTPPLNTSWDWGADRIFGVNLGGLFVLEPFISPALFQAHPDAADEWTLSADMAADGTLQSTMENHYSTFVTEQDIAQIAGAGLNWVRLPIPFWAIETWANVGVSATGSTVAEPFLARTCWSYILRVFEWARKYGIRINLDLHTIPGSQNGYNHSGKLGEINFLNGPMGVANAERALEYIRVIAEFISQPEYRDVIPMFGMVNEALLSTIGKDQLTTFYLRAYDVVRNITGIGAGNGPFLSIHDGFMGTNYWQGFLVGSDRIVLDTHPYFAFDGQPNNQPIDIPATGGNGTVYGGQWPQQACNAWGPEMNQSRNAFGVTIAGEFSNGWNDCGLWMRGVNISASYVGNCSVWEDYTQWDQATKDGIKEFALASMDALGDWFFWTWKVRVDLSLQPPLTLTPFSRFLTVKSVQLWIVLMDVLLSWNADRQLVHEQHGRVPAVVVPTRPRAGLDAHRPARGGGHVRGARRQARPMEQLVRGVADGRAGRRHDRRVLARDVQRVAADDARERERGVAHAPAAVHADRERRLAAAAVVVHRRDGERRRRLGGRAGRYERADAHRRVRVPGRVERGRVPHPHGGVRRGGVRCAGRADTAAHGSSRTKGPGLCVMGLRDLLIRLPAR
ncbi:hypothetical protein AcV7_006173 [Taiwanofungus camphoratus]|nr:hypothetical protein AcV7_006173 [Antrodia cinnamomea]